MKPIDHRRAIAKVTIDGLGICGFDKPNGIWEARLIKENKHTPSMDVEGSSINIAGANTIEIVTVNGDTPDYSVDYPKGCFYDPNIGRDTENMRWALNLKNQDDVGEALKLKDVPGILLKIHDALFYVSKIFQTNLYRVPLSVTDPNLNPEPYRFGPTSDELAADVFCKPGGEVQVLVDNSLVSRLPYDAKRKAPYLITVLNMDHVPKPGSLAGPLEKGDFECYYAACTNPTQRYAFWGLPKGDSASSVSNTDDLVAELHSDRTDCNTVWSDPYP